MPRKVISLLCNVIEKEKLRKIAGLFNDLRFSIKLENVFHETSGATINNQDWHTKYIKMTYRDCEDKL